MKINESIVEDATLTWFGELGYRLQPENSYAVAPPVVPADMQNETLEVAHE